MLQLFLPLKAVNISFMHVYKPITSSITPGKRGNLVDAPLTFNFRMGQGACHFCFWLWRRPAPYFWMFASNCLLDNQNPTPEIIDTPLTLIFRMGQGVCRYDYYLGRKPIPHLWMAETNCHFGYTRYTAKNHWRSIDAHFQNAAVTVWFIFFSEGRLPVCWLWIAATRSLFNYHTYKTTNRWCCIDAHFQNGAGSMMRLFFTWKAANTSFMNGCNQSSPRLPKMDTEKLLMLCWRSFSEWGSDCVVYSFAQKGCQCVGYG